MNRLEGFRNSLIKLSLGSYSYNLIRRRIVYYYSYGYTINIPQESCYDHFYRVLIIHCPPPYKCDYFVKEPSEKSKDAMIVILRQKFGYAYRRSSVRSRSSSRYSNSNRTYRNKEKSGISIKKGSVTNYYNHNTFHVENDKSINVIDVRKANEVEDDIHS